MSVASFVDVDLEPHTVSSKGPAADELLDEQGVTRVEPARRFGALVSIVVRILLAVLLLGAGVGAVFYSVVHSEQIARDENEHSLQHPHKAYFKLAQDQSCADGVITIERSGAMLGNDTTIVATAKNVTKLHASWIQDNSNRRLVHRVWEASEDGWRYTYFVYQSYSILATKEVGIREREKPAGNPVQNMALKQCVRINITYDNFLDSFGLSALPKVRRERVKLGDKPVSVELYQGLASYFDRNGSHSGGYSDVAGEQTTQPFLASAFTQPNQGLVYGWQAYFLPSRKANESNALLWMEFWFPNMTSNVPDTSYFFDYPIHCMSVQ